MAEDTPTIAPDIAETPATIGEEVVSESLPAAEEAQSVPAALPLEREETQSAPAEAAERSEAAEPKRKPGRPAGSRNKQPAKPRAKRVVVSEAVEAQPPPPAPSPRWDAQHQPIPTEAKTEMAELMLRLLSGQAMERQRRKDAQRRAWFS